MILLGFVFSVKSKATRLETCSGLTHLAATFVEDDFHIEDGTELLKNIKERDIDHNMKIFVRKSAKCGSSVMNYNPIKAVERRKRKTQTYTKHCS